MVGVVMFENSKKGRREAWCPTAHKSKFSGGGGGCAGNGGTGWGNSAEERDD